MYFTANVFHILIAISIILDSLGFEDSLRKLRFTHYFIWIALWRKGPGVKWYLLGHHPEIWYFKGSEKYWSWLKKNPSLFGLSRQLTIGLFLGLSLLKQVAQCSNEVIAIFFVCLLCTRHCSMSSKCFCSLTSHKNLLRIPHLQGNRPKPRKVSVLLKSTQNGGVDDHARFCVLQSREPLWLLSIRSLEHLLISPPCSDSSPLIHLW